MVLLASALFLTACGGGGTVSNPLSVTNIQTYSSGARFVRINDANYSAVAVVANGVDPVGYVNVTQVSTVSQSQNADGSYTGTYNIRLATGDTVTATGTFYTANDGRMYIVSSGGTVRAAVVDGTSASNLPTGTYNYAGQAYAEYTRGSSVYYSTSGSFTMSADFTNNSASLSASAGNATYNHTGLAIASDGSISGSNGTFRTYNVDSSLYSTNNVDFHGNFHGSGATHVSGAGIRVGSGTDYQLIAIVGDR